VAVHTRRRRKTTSYLHENRQDEALERAFVLVAAPVEEIIFRKKIFSGER
jgi:hypothetical protein